MLACGRSSAGAELVCVVDDTHRRLTIALAPPNAARSLGRTVTVGLDREGRVALQIDGLSRGG